LPTAAINASVAAGDSSSTTVAVPVAKFTSAPATPVWRPKTFCTRAAHEPHVIPPTVNSCVGAWLAVLPTCGCSPT
jgi:hypothetical protein